MANACSLEESRFNGWCFQNAAARWNVLFCFVGSWYKLRAENCYPRTRLNKEKLKTRRNYALPVTFDVTVVTVPVTFDYVPTYPLFSPITETNHSRLFGLIGYSHNHAVPLPRPLCISVTFRHRLRHVDDVTPCRS